MFGDLLGGAHNLELIPVEAVRASGIKTVDLQDEGLQTQLFGVDTVLEAGCPAFFLELLLGIFIVHSVALPVALGRPLIVPAGEPTQESFREGKDMP